MAMSPKNQAVPGPGARVELLGASHAADALREAIPRLAASDAPVFLCGETGAGKALAARGIHAASSRRAGPFLAVNCATLMAPLLADAPLDGNSPAASAQGGTLYLDEVGALPADQQAALLRLLEAAPGTDAEEATGAAAPGIRLVSSSHEDLARHAAAGGFREDLYYRISALQLRIPPLRERPGDVATLAAHFLSRFAGEQGRGPLRFSESAVAALDAHAWPGNVRELRNRVMQAVLLCEANVLGPEHLGLPVATDAPGAPPRRAVRSLRECRKQAERDAIAEALREAQGHVPVAAHALGISRAQLYRLIGRLGLPHAPNGPH